MEGDEINARFREVWAELKMQSAYVRKQADRIDALEAKPQPSGNTGELTETVGERIMREFEMRNIPCHNLAAAIDAAVKNYREMNEALRDQSIFQGGRILALEAEVKRLRDPGWIPHMSCHNSTYDAFARHVRGGGV